MTAIPLSDGGQPLGRVLKLRQHQKNGIRAPHKPLLVLLALGRIETTGHSAISWEDAKVDLARLIADFGPPSRTSPRQSAAFPFTRLRRDSVWTLDADVPDDNLRPLEASTPTGRLIPDIEDAARNPATRNEVAAELVRSHFPDTMQADVLTAAGLDPDAVLGSQADRLQGDRTRSTQWRRDVLTAWDDCCAFCTFDGRLDGVVVGIEAAHVRWFNFDGPDELDNGLALCSLHHKLFDRGVLGLTADMTTIVSPKFTARTDSGRRLWELHNRELRPRPGTRLPAETHRSWHEQQVFKQ